MKQPPVSLLLSAILLLSLPVTGCKKAKQIAAQTTGSIGVSDPTYTDAIHTAIDSGHLDALHWPDFSDIQPAVSTFYDNRNFTLAWSKDGKPTRQADALMQAISGARERGLDPEDYDAGKWKDRVANLSTSEGKTVFDTAMTVSAMRLVNALHMGRIDPQHFSFGVKVDEKQLDLPEVLDSQLTGSSDVNATLDALEPQTAQYKALKQALKHYLDLASQDHIAPLPDPGKSAASLTSGYPGIQSLTQKLQLVGDLAGAPEAANDGQPSSGQQNAGQQSAPALSDLTDALKKFQARHGLAIDGKLSSSTVAALNTPMSDRVSAISDTMERWRWLSDEYQHPALLVNLPEFELRAFEGDNETFRMRVVDGQSKEDEHHTPIIADHMKYLVFRPFWNVPVSIAKKDLVPHIEKNPGYLGEHNYETVNSKGDPEPASADRIEHGGVLVREKPGPKNSLGLVKFMFPNQFNVYLHDTNSHSLFDRTRRDYSHGCVRVQDPPKLAEWLLRDNTKWDAQAIHDTMNDETVINKNVSLSKPVPIVIFYGTAYVDGGEVHFFQDMYGYDKDLEDTLHKGAPYPKKPARERGEASV